VLAPHGHSSGGKYAPAGRRDIPALVETIEEHNYDYGVQLVRQGLVVLCSDARGFGERREEALQGDGEALLSSSCAVLNHMAMPLGQTVTGMWAWDLMRLLDYVATRPECDPNRVGCGGLSGGGLQTLWLAALDDRVRCAVISGYFYGYKDSLLKLNGNCSCNYVPGLWALADMGDLGALIAPRPLLIETGTRDPLNGERGVENVTEQVAITAQAYQVFDAQERLAHALFEGEHMWHGAEAVPWMVRWLTAQDI
jgi:dienelactone hydrolase